MASSVNMIMGDVMRNNRQGSGGQGGGRVVRGRGPVHFFNGEKMRGVMRRGPLALNARPSQYTISKPSRSARGFPWQHDLIEDSIKAAGISASEIGTKLYLSNLDYGVSNDDIWELFSELGDLKRHAVHYDKSGRSSGSAEVVYSRRSDAFAALKKYNNVLLDGKPMKIEIVGNSPEMPVSGTVSVTGVNGRRKRTVMVSGRRIMRSLPIRNRGSGWSGQGDMRSARRPRAPGQTLEWGRGWGWNRGRGRGRGRGLFGPGRKQQEEKLAEKLDQELDVYHAEAMQS